MQLNDTQRESIAKLFYDAGKIVFAALVIGQLVPKEIRHLDLLTLSAGLLIALACAVWGLYFERTKEGGAT